MKKRDLIDLYHMMQETHQERKRLGEFDANSKHMMVLLEGMLMLTENAIEQCPPDPPEGKTRR
jgi:hypothetical protein